jgi:hypothetical protein
MSIPSILLLALLGDPSLPELEAVTVPAPLDLEVKSMNLLASISRLEWERTRGLTGVDLPWSDEGAALPLPAALSAGPEFHAQVNGDYLVDDLALDLVASMAFGAAVDEVPELLGMRVSLLTDLGDQSFGLALWRAF